MKYHEHDYIIISSCASFQRNYSKCRIWFIITIILFVLYILDGLGKAFSEETRAEGLVGATVGRLILGLLLTGYELWVVWAFMEELKDERGHNVVGAAAYAPAKMNEP
jgi:hypothetical protein